MSYGCVKCSSCKHWNIDYGVWGGCDNHWPAETPKDCSEYVQKAKEKASEQ